MSDLVPHLSSGGPPERRKAVVNDMLCVFNNPGGIEGDKLSQSIGSLNIR